MRKSRFGGDPPSIQAVKSESGVVQSSLKRPTWPLSAQDSVPPSKVQRGRVVIPGDFSVLEVRVVEVAGLGNGIGWRQGRGARGLFPDMFEYLSDLM